MSSGILWVSSLFMILMSTMTVRASKLSKTDTSGVTILVNMTWSLNDIPQLKTYRNLNRRIITQT